MRLFVLSLICLTCYRVSSFDRQLRRAIEVRESKELLPFAVLNDFKLELEDSDKDDDFKMSSKAKDRTKKKASAKKKETVKKDVEKDPVEGSAAEKETVPPENDEAAKPVQRLVQKRCNADSL